MAIEYTETEVGCCCGRNSSGEWEGLYYSEPPQGDGWVEVGWVEREKVTGKKALWRRIIMAETPK